MNEDYSSQEDDAIKIVKTYDMAVRMVAKAMIAFMDVHDGVPPPMNLIYGTITKVGKKFNKNPEQVIVDVKKYIDSLTEPDSDVSYDQFIHDYATTMYKGLLKHLSGLKNIQKSNLSTKIPEKHISAISKRYNKDPEDILNDIYDEFNDIKSYKGVNENI